jgi:hypothetical protein
MALWITIFQSRKEAAMRPSSLRHGFIAILALVIVVVPPGVAGAQPLPNGGGAASLPAEANLPSSPVRTGKERLGEKWTDEQRVDNCNVPLDKRGPKPRPNPDDTHHSDC